MKREIIPATRIAQSIHLLRGQKVMLDFDLAASYGVATKLLNQAVKRNRGRCPNDLMFQLSSGEAERSIFQFGISKDRGGRRHLPYAFTEPGVAMLSSVLKCTGERTRLACWRWCPHHRHVFLRRLIPAIDSR